MPIVGFAFIFLVLNQNINGEKKAEDSLRLLCNCRLCWFNSWICHGYIFVLVLIQMEFR